jgi:hypothetical protein
MAAPYTYDCRTDDREQVITDEGAPAATVGALCHFQPPAERLQCYSKPLLHGPQIAMVMPEPLTPGSVGRPVVSP